MPSFGEELRRERELRQISLREVAEATKISLRHLEALERNEFRQLPGGVFNRGFVRAYAEFIGVSADDMVNAYLMQEQQTNGSSAAEDGLLRGSRGGGVPVVEFTESPEHGDRRIYFWGGVVIAVLLGLGLTAWLMGWFG
ncbi:MAG: helix-turn-helix domain-containing protein [Acidobacteriota bacterium]|nr:helix-turn-helix domain-containing protein [Acidobacteriota bacterium]MDH3785512.1 helix-turn-helix domain-containing protein [Acidobacteriota bacterium]